MKHLFSLLVIALCLTKTLFAQNYKNVQLSTDKNYRTVFGFLPTEDKSYVKIYGAMRKEKFEDVKGIVEGDFF